VAAVAAFVVADFIRYPVTGAPEGRAAGPPHAVTLTVTAGDSATSVAGDARALAAAMSGPRRRVRTTVAPGGAARAILALAHSPDRRGERLLYLTSHAVAELERAVRQPASAQERTEAREALAALGRLAPVAAVAAEETVVVTSADDGPATFARLVAEMRAAPAEQVVGIPAEAAAKATLAGFASALGVDGEIPYRMYPTGEAAALALASGEVGVIFAGQGQIAAERRRGGLRVLASTGRPPRAAVRLDRGLAAAGAPGHPAGPSRRWAVIVGPPRLDAATRAEQTGRVARALVSPRWREHAARRGLLRPSLPAGGLPAFLAAERERAARLADIAAGVRERLP
jgi:hypothetical protein